MLEFPDHKKQEEKVFPLLIKFPLRDAQAPPSYTFIDPKHIGNFLFGFAYFHF
jgi:hypothetical protein